MHLRQFWTFSLRKEYRVNEQNNLGRTPLHALLCKSDFNHTADRDYYTTMVPYLITKIKPEDLKKPFQETKIVKENGHIKDITVDYKDILDFFDRASSPTDDTTTSRSVGGNLRAIAIDEIRGLVKRYIRQATPSETQKPVQEDTTPSIRRNSSLFRAQPIISPRHSSIHKETLVTHLRSDEGHDEAKNNQQRQETLQPEKSAKLPLQVQPVRSQWRVLPRVDSAEEMSESHSHQKALGHEGLGDVILGFPKRKEVPLRTTRIP